MNNVITVGIDDLEVEDIVSLLYHLIKNDACIPQDIIKKLAGKIDGSKVDKYYSDSIKNLLKTFKIEE